MPSIHPRPTAPAARPATPAAPALKLRFRLEGRTLDADRITAMVAAEPKKLAAALKGGLAVEASPQAIRAVRGTALGPYVGEHGEVEVQAVTGMEDALIVFALIGMFVAVVYGYSEGFADGVEAASETDGEGGDDTGGEGEGGQDGGDGEGP